MFNNTEREVFGKLVDQASDTLSNEGCNDWDVKLTASNRHELADMYVASKQDGDEFPYELRAEVNALPDGSILTFNNWQLMSYLRDLIENGRPRLS